MEKTTLLISSLLALTAIVKLAQSIIEYKSARGKQPSDAKMPIPVTTTSQNSQRTSSFRWRFFNSVMRYSCLAFIIYSAASVIGRDRPATAGDIAIIGGAIGLMILYNDPL